MLLRYHDHWSVADERLELLDFERLHVMAQLSEPISRAEGTRLVTLAQASGWAEMDALIADEGVDAAQEMEAALGRSAYLERVSQSLEVYREAFVQAAIRHASVRVGGDLRPHREGLQGRAGGASG